MITLRGKSAFGGIAIGKLVYYKRDGRKIKRYHAGDCEAEIKRFEKARMSAIQELKILYDRAVQDVGESAAMIFEIHQMILGDQGYIESVKNIITEREVNAEYAVVKTTDKFSAVFETIDDIYMQGRAADVKDVSGRILNILSGTGEQKVEVSEPAIIMADDFAPSETIRFEKEKVLALVTQHGTVNSHTAILARTMNIPTVVSLGKELISEYEGYMAVVDGFDGVVYVDPDEKMLEEMREKQKEICTQRELLDELKGKENVTKSGQKIQICANIGSSADVWAALNNDAGGIGLFRSEFLYLENKTFPTEEEQFTVYKMVTENMAGKRVVIRTLDAGADKQPDYFNLPAEENPALGYRAIRISLNRPDIFKIQLRAIYRASAYGKIAVLFPMITSLWEVKKIKKIVEMVKEELWREKAAFDEDVELGIMVETPAAVMISRELAKEVDFFSVGTNDLTQYTLAVDRQNSKLSEFYDTRHPAVMAMIKMAADNAHAEGKWIGICGELGADMELTEDFLEMKIDELSVPPSMILPLRQKIREIE